MDWLSQDIRKIGERHLTDSLKKFHMENEDSNIIFLKEDERVFAHIANICPFEYGINGALGFRYDAIKDFIRWNSDEDADLDEIYKEHISTFLHLGSFMASEIRSNRK